MSEMNASIDAALLDRLVDGELDSRAQTELLARLDERPGEWRRLALAFVEAQTLGVELRGVVAEAKQSPARAANTSLAATVARSGASPWSRFFSLAATMLIAVGIGFGVGRAWNSHNRPRVENPAGPTNANIATTNPPSLAAPTSIDELSPQGLMTVRTTDGSPVQLPVYEASLGAEQMLNSTESSVPPEVIRALRSRGHEVKQQRRYWPVDLGDGRQIIVPVDQVDVQYVGDRAYQ